jgi:hypothetical protein
MRATAFLNGGLHIVIERKGLDGSFHIGGLLSILLCLDFAMKDQPSYRNAVLCLQQV